MKKNIKIISVGGSIIIPKTGFNIEYLKKFRKMIIDRIKTGEKFVLVVGGGATARYYQEAGKMIVKSNNHDLDWIGIYATVLNASFVKQLFGEYAYKNVVSDPRRKVKTNKPIIVASGWKPGFSTDYDAVLLAKAYGSKELFNLSNIDYVYDKDPAEYKDAEVIKSIKWPEFRKKIVGYHWVAGSNVPFDPVASREAQKMGLNVKILNGNNINQVKKALNGEKFVGTEIS